MTPLYLDLDGPLLDVSPRYHRVHAEIVEALGGEPTLDRAAYWVRKRRGEGIAALMAAEGLAVPRERYLERWLARVEADDVLVLDALQPRALEALASIAAARPVVLVTLRQRRRGLEAELDRLGLRPLLHAVLSASPLEGPGDLTKERLVRGLGLPLEGSWLAGDTEHDLRAARRLGLRAAGVTCGIREAGLLERESPDLLVHDLAALAPHL